MSIVRLPSSLFFLLTLSLGLPACSSEEDALPSPVSRSATPLEAVVPSRPALIVTGDAMALAEDWIRGASLKSRLELRSSDDGRALLEVAEGRAAGALVHRQPTEAEHRLARGRGLVAGPTLRSKLILRAPVSILVHDDNPVQRLPAATVGAIFSGRLHNWSELGGAAGSIVVFGTDPASPSAQLVQEWLLGEESASVEIRQVSSLVAVGISVSGEPGAIGWGIPAGSGSRPLPLEWDGTLLHPRKPPGSSLNWPMHLPLYLVTVGEPGKEVTALLDHGMGGAGQAAVENRGFTAVPEGWTP